jgi:dipeptidyl aminopeptidase/acylaminoacyl peptidase
MRFVCCSFFLCLVLLMSCGDDDATKPDVTPPGKVEDLAVVDSADGVITLAWTAPGDDGAEGRAARYDIRCSFALASEADWSAATLVADSTRVPKAAGETESLAVAGLDEGAWLFALKTADEVPNWSAMSNVASVTLIDSMPPEQVTDLAAVMVTAVTVKLAWTAPGDDGAEGTASAYDLRYALTPITAETWGAALQVEGMPAPKLHGSAESCTVTGLEQATGYYFALKTTDNAGNESDLSNVVSKSTANLVRLTVTPPSCGYCSAVGPEWSPDGQTIAFTATWTEGPPNAELYLVPANGGQPVCLTDEPGYVQDPSWSPDGTQLVFLSEHTPNHSSMWIMDAAPYAPLQEVLTETMDLEQFGECVWSPDGGRIAYYIRELSAIPPSTVVRCDLYVIDVLAGDPQFVYHDTNQIKGLDWSPDGTQIAFGSTRGGNYDVWVLPVSGGAPVQLTHDPAFDMRPEWSSDGSRIAFVSDRTGNWEIWSMTSTGEDPTQLTFGPGAKFNSSWSPDGKGIAFDSWDWENENGDIWVLRWD